MKASRKALLAGAALIAPAMVAPAASAADVPVLASPDTYGGWYIDHSSMEFGGQVFIHKPGTTRADNRAKFSEYGNRTDPAFLNFLDFGLATKDGHYTAELYGKNIGKNDQDLELDLAQPGTQYLTLGWYQTPHLRSTTAQSIFGGNGTGALTVDPAVQAALNAAITQGQFGGVGTNTGTGGSVAVPVTNQTPGGSSVAPNGCLLSNQAGTAQCITKGGAALTPVQTTILANEKNINLGLQRDRKEINYRWTPSPDWDVNVNYSNEHRWGLQEQGFLFSTGTSSPMAQVAAPVDDTTQDASISGEYSGYSPWGLRWNGILRFDTSIYTDRYSSFTAENPFGGPGSLTAGQTCPVASATAILNCYGIGQMGTEPNNGSNTFSATTGIDLPWFKSSRYMGTFNYNMMTQNASFIPMTINPGPISSGTSGATVPVPTMPRTSLDGHTDTLLFNNVLTTEFNSYLRNKLSYRYYSIDNNTAALTLASWVVNDAALAGGTGTVGSGSYAPHTTLFSAYTKQNASDELTWSPARWLNVGVNSGWEQYQYSLHAANITNEYIEKAFADAHPADWLTLRASGSVGWRRYDNYNWQAYLGNEILCNPTVVMGNSCLGNVAATGNITGGFSENPLLRDFNIANRDRSLANFYVDIETPIQGLTVTPTAGWRWDNYPNDPNFLGAGSNTQLLGLQTDHNWNAGIEASYTISPAATITASYTREQSSQTLISTATGGSCAALGTTPTVAGCDINMYTSGMNEAVNTWLVAANFQVIPDRLSLKVSFTHSNSTDSWNTGPFGNNCSGGSCFGGANIAGIVSAGAPAFPNEYTTFNQADATLTYKVDPALMTQFGSKGEAFLKLRYLYERNSVTNWQNDATQAYMYQALNSSTTSFKDLIFMAGNNPNYNAQAIMASLVVKW